MKSKGNNKKEHVSKVDKIDRKSTVAPKKDRSSKRRLSIYDEYDDDESYDDLNFERDDFDDGDDGDYDEDDYDEEE